MFIYMYISAGCGYFVVCDVSLLLHNILVCEMLILLFCFLNLSCRVYGKINFLKKPRIDSAWPTVIVQSTHI